MIKVKQVTDQNKLTALELLYSVHPERDRQAYLTEILKAEQQGQFNLTGLFLAESAAGYAGSGLCIVQSDGTAYVWPPVVAADYRQHADSQLKSAIEDALMRAMNDYLDQQQAWLAQALLECGDTATHQIFLRNQYKQLTDLNFMSKALTSDPGYQHPDEIQWIGYDQKSTHQRFIDVIEQTYVDSLDCPELNHLRTAEQALESYKMSGHFDPAMWLLLHQKGVDLGVLLLTAHTEEQSCELIYFGLVAEARGMGFGRTMLNFAMQHTYHKNLRSLFLAVDERNEYAIRLYEALGFRKTTSRSVCMRFQQSIA